MALNILDDMVVTETGYKCSCCQITFAGIVKPDRLQRLCETCKSHAGGGDMQRNREHVAAWQMWRDRALGALATAKRETALADSRAHGLSVQNADLRRSLKEGLEATAPDVLAKYFETEAVVEAHGQRDAAYRARDHAMGLFWTLDQAHHSDGPSTPCSCGNTRCKIPDVLDDYYQDYARWEGRQIDRARTGKPNQLPVGHPDARRYGV